MRIGINLRGDLAKLSVQELSDRIDVLFAERADVSDSISDLMSVGNKTLYQSGWGLPFGRGLIHASLVYKMTGFFYGGSHKRGLGRLYVIDCELKDLIDECRRRT
ncbi:protein of unknown function [Methylorubrum extorquens]|uniref:Uncharacterized protein n=1 Tax=Methylorubrum extorquens TaxID=408 RepID=A0A2N9AY20_METEX|nr:protein of unknown function [Methylorubrum extorquens]